MAAVLPPLLAAEGPGEVSMELLKGLVNPLKGSRIHRPTSQKPLLTRQLSYPTTRRCITSIHLPLFEKPVYLPHPHHQPLAASKTS